MVKQLCYLLVTCVPDWVGIQTSWSRALLNPMVNQKVDLVRLACLFLKAD